LNKIGSNMRALFSIIKDRILWIGINFDSWGTNDFWGLKAVKTIYL